MWRTEKCPSHGFLMHRVEPNGDTTCLYCLSTKATDLTKQGLSGEVRGIANGVFCLSEDGARTIAAEIRNALQPAQTARDEIESHKGDRVFNYVALVEDFDLTIARLKALADAFDGK